MTRRGYNTVRPFYKNETGQLINFDEARNIIEEQEAEKDTRIVIEEDYFDWLEEKAELWIKESQ